MTMSRAPSMTCPIAAAPSAATTISRSTSRVRSLSAFSPSQPGSQPPVAYDTAYSGPQDQAGAPVSWSGSASRKKAVAATAQRASGSARTRVRRRGPVPGRAGFAPWTGRGVRVEVNRGPYGRGT